VAEAGDARYQALPRALAGAAAFQTAVSKLVYDVLMIKACPSLICSASCMHASVKCCLVLTTDCMCMTMYSCSSLQAHCRFHGAWLRKRR